MSSNIAYYEYQQRGFEIFRLGDNFLVYVVDNVIDIWYPTDKQYLRYHSLAKVTTDSWVIDIYNRLDSLML